MYCWRAGIILLSFWPTISWSGLRKLVQPFQGLHGLQNKNHWDDWDVWDGLWVIRFYKRPFNMFTFFSTHRLLCKSRRCISLRARSKVYVNIMTSKKVKLQIISKGQGQVFNFCSFILEPYVFFASMKEISCFSPKIVSFLHAQKS